MLIMTDMWVITSVDTWSEVKHRECWVMWATAQVKQVWLLEECKWTVMFSSRPDSVHLCVLLCEFKDVENSWGGHRLSGSSGSVIWIISCLHHGDQARWPAWSSWIPESQPQRSGGKVHIIYCLCGFLGTNRCFFLFCLPVVADFGGCRCLWSRVLELRELAFNTSLFCESVESYIPVVLSSDVNVKYHASCVFV